MRGFSKISPALWDSERFNTLPSDDGRYLYLYLLTCRHQTSAGAYKLPDGYAATDLRWKPERYLLARESLVEVDLIRFDSQTSVVMITRWFKHNPPMNADHLKSIEGELERLPSLALAEEAHGDLVMIQESIEAERAAQRLPAGKNPPMTLLMALAGHSVKGSAQTISTASLRTPCRHRVHTVSTYTDTDYRHRRIQD